MKALLFSFVVLALGCAQVPKKEEPNPLTILLEKQADWLAKENDLRDQLRAAVRTGEEAEQPEDEEAAEAEPPAMGEVALVAAAARAGLTAGTMAAAMNMADTPKAKTAARARLLAFSRMDIG